MVALSDITNALTSRFENKLVRQMNRSVPLASMFKATPGQGKNVQWDVVTGSGLAVAHGEGADAPAAQSDTVTPATLVWADYADTIGITGRAAAAAAAAGNPSQLAALFDEQLEQCVQRMADRLATDLLTGDPTASPEEISGLLDATNGALKATGTYAGINKGSITQFAGNELLNGGVDRALTLDLLDDAIQATYDACGMWPDLLVASSTQWKKYGQLFDGKREYIDNVRTAAGEIKLDGGFKAISHAGIPMIMDRTMPNDTIMGLNTSYCEWKYLPHVMGNKEMLSVHGTEEFQKGRPSLPIKAKIQPLAITGDNYKFELIAYTQFQVKKPNSCFILGDLQA